MLMRLMELLKSLSWLMTLEKDSEISKVRHDDLLSEAVKHCSKYLSC
jgi:hypothetical protein